MKHIYLDVPLHSGVTIPLPEDVRHRLGTVLRLHEGDQIYLFNGRDGLFSGTLTQAKSGGKSPAAVAVGLQTQPFCAQPQLALALGVPKRDAWESALRQATELGVTTIIPLKTEFGVVGKLNTERATAILIEAAEQCERHDIPTLAPLTSLKALLESAPSVAWAYERAHEQPKTQKKAERPTPTTVLVGPEGGFSPEEIAQLLAAPNVYPFSLGTTILRTDTAVVAAVASQKLNNKR